MKKVILVLLGVFVYSAFVIAMAPARFAISFIPLPTHISLGSVSGTVWSGQVTSAQVDNLRLEFLEWEFLPSKLLALKLAANIKIGRSSSDVTGKGQIGVSTSNLAINDLNIKTSVEYLTTLVSLPAGLSASGELLIRSARYVHSEPWCDTLDGQIKATNALIASDMGQVPVKLATVDLSCDNGSLVAITKPGSNSLGIDVVATLSTSSELKLNGVVLPPSDAPRDFINLLQFSGGPDGQGRYPIEFNMQLN